jgi:hypothetical protein
MTEPKKGTTMALKRIGDLEPGDIIRGLNGQPVKAQPFEEHIPDSMYELELVDDNCPEKTVTARVSGNHLWYVESSFDRSYHAERRREGKRLLRQLTPEILAELRNVAMLEDPAETTLMDMVMVCELEENSRGIAVLERIAQSLGPIIETKTTYVDYSTGEAIGNEKHVRGYDARQFAQQILSLHGIKADRKRWPLIVGRVMTTIDMLEIADMVTIPTMRSIG